ncbi:fusion protein [Wenzhou Myotis davidii paramyxovirus 1]|uniref:Fusion glycoprotein F0 n=1 Tax=Wenzhou Myotis davidii paramyxovirus 1 TaxID=2928979 RepID=A0A8T9KNA3_9MONO|nr:fusion protein [Wenzhou Myotis davidii paramyxovirus 1]WPV62572.1 MAG: fusion protein [Wenzhou bat jeilongvirus 1]
MEIRRLIISLIVLDCICSTISQVAFTELSKIGIIKGKNYGLKLRGISTTQLIVIKLIPNLENLTGCTSNALDDYKRLLDKVILPIDQAIKTMRDAISQKDTSAKFWGAVIGGVALGIATSAQITAGVALHNSLQNAKAVEQLKESIRNTNQAVTELTTAGRKTVLALSALQDQINTIIVPSINSLGCEVAKNTLALRLNQYFSEISFVFGPNLREPASQTISIQALARAFNNDFESILSKLGYTSEDLLDVLESNSIQARIIGVDTTNYFITLQVEYPTITKIMNAVVQSFNLISFNHRGSEWMPVFPRNILIRMNLISNIDLTSCSQTSNNYICPQDTSSPISYPLYSCITGNTSKCIASRNVNSQVSRYALSDGVIFANCVPILCQCHTTGQNIVQDRSVSNVMITKDDCPEVFLDGLFITLGPKKMNRSMYSDDYKIGGQVNIDPVDIGSDISQIQESLNKTQDFIDKSNSILDRINPSIITGPRFIYLIVITVVLLIWITLLTLWIIYLTKSLNDEKAYSRTISGSSTINSLSSLISR